MSPFPKSPERFAFLGQTVKQTVKAIENDAQHTNPGLRRGCSGRQLRDVMRWTSEGGVIREAMEANLIDPSDSAKLTDALSRYCDLPRRVRQSILHLVQWLHIIRKGPGIEAVAEICTA